jgi:outer membrane autotransporter protein
VAARAAGWYTAPMRRPSSAILPALLLAAAALPAVEGIDPGTTSQNTLIAVGRWAQTSAAAPRGYGILDLPAWTLDKNHAWVLELGARGLTARTTTALQPALLWDAANARPTVYARELAQLAALGYQRAGNWLVAPTAAQARPVAGTGADIFYTLDATIPAGVDPANYLAARLTTAFGVRPDLRLAFPGLRADPYGVVTRSGLDHLTLLHRLAAPAPDAPAGWSFWGRGDGQRSEAAADASSGGYRSYGWTGAVGAVLARGGLCAGLALASGETRAEHLGACGLDLRSRYRDLVLGAAWTAGRFHLAGQASAGDARHQSERNLAITSVGNPRATALTAAAEGTGWTAGAGLEAGWTATVASCAITPAAALQYGYVTNPGFSESGGDELGLNLERQTQRSLAATLGGTVERPLALGACRLLPRLGLGWRRECYDDPAIITAAFAESPQERFAMAGLAPPRDQLVASLALTLAGLAHDHLAITLGYDGRYGDGSRSHAGVAGLSWGL